MAKMMSLIKYFRRMFDCDTVRISQPIKIMFLIIGHKRNTKDDPGQWIRDGEPFDFDYTAEKTIASGKTKKELIASAKEYKRLCGITTKEYLAEIFDVGKKTLLL